MAESIEHCTNCRVVTDRSPAFIRRDNITFRFNCVFVSCRRGLILYLTSRPQFNCFLLISVCLPLSIGLSTHMEINKYPSEVNLSFTPNRSNKLLNLQNKGKQNPNITFFNPLVVCFVIFSIHFIKDHLCSQC